MKPVLHFIFTLHLHGIVRFDKSIQVCLQFVQRKLKFSSEGRQKKLLQQEPVELFAKVVVGLAGLVHRQMLDVGGGKESFKWVGERQTAIFARFSSVNFLDRNSPALKKGDNTARKYIDGIHRIFCGIDFCKGDAGIAVHDCFDVDTARSGNIAHIFDRAEEKHFLEKRESVFESHIFSSLFFPEFGLSFHAWMSQETRFYLKAVRA